MMEIVNRTDIQLYAQRNTSPKMPIEKKYVYAFIDSLMNSTSLQELYENLKDEMQNGDAFIIFNSFSNKARNLNKEPYRSIIAYSMLKKDIRLFELISASMFTGKVFEYHGSDLYTDVAKHTDESPWKYTDAGLYTDMSEGLIQIGFQNYYCDKPAQDGAGSEYQTLEELNASLLDFDYIITLTKPARVMILLFYVPYCYLSGTSTELYSTGIDTSSGTFSAPFGDPISMEILNGYTDNEIIELYREVRMYDTELQTDRAIEFEREVQRLDDAILISFDMKCQSSVDETEEGTKEYIWSDISVLSNTSDNKTYVVENVYNANNIHFEKYIPIMLRLENRPDAPCLAYQVVHEDCRIGAMFYTRERI